MKQTQRMARLSLAAVLVTAACARTAHATVNADDKVRVSALTSVSAVVPEDGAQAEDPLFAGTQNLGAKAKESNEVNLDKSMLALAARKGGEKAELAQKLDLVSVRNYEYANEGDYNLADVQSVLKRLEGDGWKHLVKTRDGKEMTDVCVKQDAEGMIRELVVISAEAKELSLVHLRGNNLSMGDMHSVGGMMRGVMHDDPSKQEPQLKKH